MTSPKAIISKIPPPLSVVETPSIMTDRFYFRSKGSFKIIRIASIRHIEAKQSYVNSHTINGIYQGIWRSVSISFFNLQLILAVLDLIFLRFLLIINFSA